VAASVLAAVKKTGFRHLLVIALAIGLVGALARQPDMP
jgi:hypothetical protein